MHPFLHIFLYINTSCRLKNHYNDLKSTYLTVLYSCFFDFIHSVHDIMINVSLFLSPPHSPTYSTFIGDVSRYRSMMLNLYFYFSFYFYFFLLVSLFYFHTYHILIALSFFSIVNLSLQGQ